MSIKFIVWFLVLTSLLFINNKQSLGQNQATNKEINIYFFWMDDCPYCAKAKEFLPKLESKYPNIKIKAFEISSHNDNLKVMQIMEAAYGATSRGVPEFFIGAKYHQGFESEKTDGLTIEQMIQKCLAKTCPDPSDETINYVNKLNQQNKFAGPYLIGLILLVILIILIGIISTIIKNKKNKQTDDSEKLDQTK